MKIINERQLLTEFAWEVKQWSKQVYPLLDSLNPDTATLEQIRQSVNGERQFGETSYCSHCNEPQTELLEIREPYECWGTHFSRVCRKCVTELIAFAESNGFTCPRS